MTEGIIQQVFNESWLKHTENELWNQLKQELIEKIKQNIHTTRLGVCVSSDEFVYLKDLIGDNKK